MHRTKSFGVMICTVFWMGAPFLAPEPVSAQVDTRTPVQFPGRTTTEESSDSEKTALSQEDLDRQRNARFTAPDVLEGNLSDTEYLLGPMDLLSVTIAAGEVRTERVPVLPEGVVVIPNVGVIPASGRSLREFREALRQAVGQRYQNFELYCYLARAREVRVYVTGEVKVPGTVVAKTYERVADVIDRATGFTEFASQRNIELRDVDGNLLAQVDLASYYANADLAANPPILQGQVIFVPTRVKEAELIGQIARPGVHELRDGETLRQLLDLAGGTLPHADLSRVNVELLSADGTPLNRTIDLTRDNPTTENVVRVTVLSTLVGKPRVVLLPPIGPRKPFYLAEGDSLLDLAMRIGDLDFNADLSHAVLATRDVEGNAVSVPVDLNDVLSGGSNRLLFDGDILSIPGPRDFIYITGFVTRPGRYNYRSDWRLGHYIGEAGGTARGGNLTSAVVLREDGSKAKLTRNDPLQRGDTIHVERSTGGKWVAGLAILSNFSALIISVVALTR